MLHGISVLVILCSEILNLPFACMELLELISTFDPIALDEMDQVRLMTRKDTKFVFGEESLIPLLQEIKGDYRVLDVKGIRSNRYRTLYLDTDAFDFYLQHQNGKLNRNKVRYRKYVDSDLCFLEVKFKNNKGQTVKKRIEVEDFEKEMSAENKAFIDRTTALNKTLEPKLWNTFNRITFVNNQLKERLTIDYNLHFEFGEDHLELPHVIIAELKQERINRNSPFAAAAKKMGIRDTRMSKYCIGSALLNDELKHNRFKSKILTLKKITDGLVA